RQELPKEWKAKSRAFVEQVSGAGADIATRKASENALNGIGPLLPELIGGSADLTGSNNTWWKGCRGFNKEDPAGNYIFYGVREFGMSAIINGITLHGGFIAYGGTFLTFSDYARNALRLACLMGIGSIYIYTHDSIGLGEDGPTHQSVEHLASLRLMPNMEVWRPADDTETAVAWNHAIERRDGPVSMALSRQNLPHFARSQEQVTAISRGGYTLVDCAGTPDAILIATGSEVGLAANAAKKLAEKGIKARVVSMPCTSVFDSQDKGYRDGVLPPQVKARVAIEAGVTAGWLHYVGPAGRVVGLDRYGESAPAKDVFEYFDFTVDNVVKQVEASLDRT
ncbi:MAG TPA: transketolase C-terminal domain-containing protein, partial [Gammaproteobacteria bacterium]